MIDSPTWYGHDTRAIVGSSSDEGYRFGDIMVVVLVLGYLTMRKSFAYLGVPPLYIGEIALGAFLLLYPGSVIWRWLASLCRPQTLSHASWWLYGFAAYGGVQFIRGVASGENLRLVIQEMVFHVYPVFLFIGVWAGTRHPDLLRKTLRVLAWTCGLYGILFVTYFGRTSAPWYDSDVVVSIFGTPIGAGVALLGLITFEQRLAPVLPLLVLNAVVFLGLEERSALLGFAICIALWGFLSGRLFQLTKVGTVVVLIVVFGLLTRFANPVASDHRFYSLSANELIGRAIAPINTELAERFTENADLHAATASWRTAWWSAIWTKVHQTPLRATFGLGYGYPIWELHPEELTRVIRTPHNATMFALGYTGWVGVLLFYAFQISLVSLLWKVYRQTGQPFGLCFWLMSMVQAQFDCFFEAPFGAIPFYLIIGLSVAPLLPGNRAQDVKSVIGT